ncbi:slipin family protein [Patescibacteria group bacterium]|nr:slipin family protein [Patescibacteria group bacterium]MBU4452944.1 slipin family protein [Patescibacteria group bacterium]MCG2687922.1 slipin family protein [Candidatus Parcubacteria bacterium]
MGYPIFVIVLFVLVVCIRQVNQGHIGVKYRLGKYIGMRQPGWRIVIPVFESMKKVDIRVKAVDVPDQEAITKDNISARINAVIYYRVSDADKAVNVVEDFRYAVSQLAQTTMRNVVGELELDQLLSERESASSRIRDIVDQLTDPWGIKVENVELKDITLPEEMKRVIGKQAEAERERRSVVIKAQGEVEAATNLSQAAQMLSANPGALHLRTLSTLNDLSSDQSNTVIFAVPLEILRAFEGLAEGKSKE